MREIKIFLNKNEKEKYMPLMTLMESTKVQMKPFCRSKEITLDQLHEHPELGKPFWRYLQGKTPIAVVVAQAVGDEGIARGYFYSWVDDSAIGDFLKETHEIRLPVDVEAVKIAKGRPPDFQVPIYHYDSDKKRYTIQPGERVDVEGNIVQLGSLVCCTDAEKKKTYFHESQLRRVAGETWDDISTLLNNRAVGLPPLQLSVAREPDSIALGPDLKSVTSITGTPSYAGHVLTIEDPVVDPVFALPIRQVSYNLDSLGTRHPTINLNTIHDSVRNPRKYVMKINGGESPTWKLSEKELKFHFIVDPQGDDLEYVAKDQNVSAADIKKHPELGYPFFRITNPGGKAWNLLFHVDPKPGGRQKYATWNDQHTDNHDYLKEAYDTGRPVDVVELIEGNHSQMQGPIPIYYCKSDSPEVQTIGDAERIDYVGPVFWDPLKPLSLHCGGMEFFQPQIKFLPQGWGETERLLKSSSDDGHPLLFSISSKGAALAADAPATGEISGTPSLHGNVLKLSDDRTSPVRSWSYDVGFLKNKNPTEDLDDLISRALKFGEDIKIGAGFQCTLQSSVSAEQAAQQEQLAVQEATVAAETAQYEKPTKKERKRESGLAKRETRLNEREEKLQTREAEVTAKEEQLKTKGESQARTTVEQAEKEEWFKYYYAHRDLEYAVIDEKNEALQQKNAALQQQLDDQKAQLDAQREMAKAAKELNQFAIPLPRRRNSVAGNLSRGSVSKVLTEETTSVLDSSQRGDSTQSRPPRPRSALSRLPDRPDR
jgi:hypothetical protein